MDIFLQYILTVCGVASMGGIIWAQFRRGNRNESGEIIDFYKKQAADYKEILETTRKEYTEKHETLVKEVGFLRGELNAEKKLREQAENILKDRNPETQDFMKFMMDTQKEVVIILKEIHKMTTAEHERDFQITSTVTKT